MLPEDLFYLHYLPNGLAVLAYIIFFKVSRGCKRASKATYVPTKSTGPPFVFLFIKTVGQRTREIWRKFNDNPLIVPLKAPSFIISVNKKLKLFGRPILARDEAACLADTNLSTPEINSQIPLRKRSLNRLSLMNPV